MTSGASQESGAPPGFRPEELPPVSPPSAGFIVQLFLIPALIVMAVVAVWALFGKIADSDSDWQTLTQELGSSNEHRRGRAALGLAQLIQSQKDRELPDAELRLAENPVVVEALVKLFQSTLSTASQTDQAVQQMEFLARTMGALELDDQSLPVLAQAMTDDRPQTVRQSALMAVAMIASRGWEPATESDNGVVFPPPPSSPTITNAAVLEQLKRAAQDPQPVIRHLAAYTLANVGGEDSLRQLKAMLLDGDRFARANAAVGLARSNSLDGLDELATILADAMESFDPTTMEDSSQQERNIAAANFPSEQARLVSNSLRAVQQLWPLIQEPQRTSLLESIRRIESDFPAATVATQAAELLRVLPEIAAPGKFSPVEQLLE